MEKPMMFVSTVIVPLRSETLFSDGVWLAQAVRLRLSSNRLNSQRTGGADNFTSLILCVNCRSEIFQSGKIVVSDLTGYFAKSFSEIGASRVLAGLKLFVSRTV
jgi:hypothetical protein